MKCIRLIKKTWGDHGGARRYLESVIKKTNTLQNSDNISTATSRAQSIKLGLGVHADSIVVVRIVDGQTPQPAQRFSPEKFLDWVKKQLALADKLYACYEAEGKNNCR